METTSSHHATISLQHVSHVFLDRDGVINQKPREGEYIGNWNDFHLIPGAESAIAALNHSKKRVIVVTNQRGVALGLYTSAKVETLHSRFQEHLLGYGAHVDAFYFCPHDKDQCHCRKPEIGMFKQAFHDFPEASPHNSIMIGDSISDIDAAVACGMPSIFIQGDPKTQKPGADKAARLADFVAASLHEAVDRLLR